MWLVVVILAILGVVVVIAWFIFGRHPEQTASHEVEDRHGAAQIYGDVDGRPAGPDAEGQNVVAPGQISPGDPRTRDR
jgi:hypothetical protein